MSEGEKEGESVRERYRETAGGREGKRERGDLSSLMDLEAEA